LGSEFFTFVILGCEDDIFGSGVERRLEIGDGELALGRDSDEKEIMRLLFFSNSCC